MHTDFPLRINSPSVVSETVDDEVIIINLDSGAYYSLQGTAAAIWELIEKHETCTGIAADICRHYEGDDARIRSEVSRFLDKLEAENLIVADGQQASAAPVPPQGGAADPKPVFHPPNLSKYTDMEHFLQVDPIHDVGDRGWPNVKKK